MYSTPRNIQTQSEILRRDVTGLELPKNIPQPEAPNPNPKPLNCKPQHPKTLNPQTLSP